MFVVPSHITVLMLLCSQISAVIVDRNDHEDINKIHVLKKKKKKHTNSVAR